ncbi:uncharacterized protein HD556DRAFT_1391528 [Suillus plorans]|uniref:Uncharacterized protein n=1 Tax=Suillus plorans TaxID=116603 RepID=A0A9P7DEN4_9AGAM|nr:uncharacterized protein HD556DRAFT_1391528 [Suillus plorans]KAG1790399.1 hypothetical protein HD556DRAFT_1391528 [Suillus plorans]
MHPIFGDSLFTLFLSQLTQQSLCTTCHHPYLKHNPSPSLKCTLSRHLHVYRNDPVLVTLAIFQSSDSSHTSANDHALGQNMSPLPPWLSYMVDC